MASTTQTMTHTNNDTQINIDTLACQQLGIKQCDLNRIKLKQFKKHGYDFNVIPNVVMHDVQTFDPLKVVSEYLRCDTNELNAVKNKYELACNRRKEHAKEYWKQKMAKLSNEERKALYKRTSSEYYSKNSDLIRERKLLRYRNDEDYKLK
jgi:hypothetical protein